MKCWEKRIKDGLLLEAEITGIKITKRFLIIQLIRDITSFILALILGVGLLIYLPEVEQAVLIGWFLLFGVAVEAFAIVREVMRLKLFFRGELDDIVKNAEK